MALELQLFMHLLMYKSSQYDSTEAELGAAPDVALEGLLKISLQGEL